VLDFKGKLDPAVIDKHSPAGRFLVYSYGIAEPTHLNLVCVVWLLDTPHACDFREAKLQWEYFKHWSWNADGR
jgi:hypothetical protein